MCQIDIIVDILKEKNFKIAAEKIKAMNKLDSFGTENFLHDIILERWVYKPKDIPFAFARDIWKRKDADIEKNKRLLRAILEYPIADVNKAKINDFLWVVEGDIKAANEAVKYYQTHLENTEEFNFTFFAINRFISISKKINSKDINDSIRTRLLMKVLDQYNNEDHGKVLYLIQTAIDEKVDVNFLISLTERVLNTYDEQNPDFNIIGRFCDVLETLYCKKNKWSNRGCITEPLLVTLRKRKVKALMTAARIPENSDAGSLLRSIKFQKDAVNILKTISGTENERKEILKGIDKLEKKAVLNMPVLSASVDCRESIVTLLEQIQDFDKEEALCYFAIFIPLPKKSDIEGNVLRSANELLGFGSLFPIGIIGQDGKSIAKSKPIKNKNGEIDEDALSDAVEQKASELMNVYSQIVIQNVLYFIRAKFIVNEEDILKIIENSIIIPESRRNAYLRGIIAGFRGDFLTALCILIPQVENSIRQLALECGEPVYNLNENGIEEIKTLNAILSLQGVKEQLDEDFLLALKTIFCSKFGFNMRNNIAHGLMEDNNFNSYNALYTWWFIFKMCYMFCGELRLNNFQKVRRKLQDLSEDNNDKQEQN